MMPPVQSTLLRRLVLPCAGALGLAVALAGCTVTHYENTRPPPAPAAAPPPAPPPPPPAATPAPPPPPAADMTGWQKLGERWTKDGTSRDAMILNLGGRYSAIRLKADQSALEVHELIITFADDSTYSPKIRHTFRQGSVSPAIDLPANKRGLKRIDYAYTNTVATRRAQLEVWAR